MKKNNLQGQVVRLEVEKLHLENEIERLNKELDKTRLSELNKEYIIYEFNKFIENEINESKLEENYERVDNLKYCLAILRELKGADKVNEICDYLKSKGE